MGGGVSPGGQDERGTGFSTGQAGSGPHRGLCGPLLEDHQSCLQEIEAAPVFKVPQPKPRHRFWFLKHKPRTQKWFMLPESKQCLVDWQQFFWKF